MTPYEKAKHLIRRFQYITLDFEAAKKCALFMINDIIDEKTDYEEDSAYWQEVKIETHAMTDPWVNTEARADRFNEEL
jgi:hypothetical protein